jgi:hypothetical protein
VYEYSKKFNHLSQYGSYHANTDEKKMSVFHQGFSPMLREHLTLLRGCTLNELVSTTIEQEDACHARLEERGRRGLCLGLMGVLHPSTAWSTLHRQAIHVVPLHRNKGGSIHLSTWPHILSSTRNWLLHLELRSLLG